ncbi:MAG: 3'-5' exonuclease [Peptococcaceae bacterium]|nr:3'-5' exonuclease [Peptococcaceae bacterium]
MVIDYFDIEAELLERPAPALPDKRLADRIKELARRGWAKIPGQAALKELNYAVIDLETTGLSPRGSDEIISIGAVLIQNGRIRPEPLFHRLVNPRRDIPEQVASLTGITSDMVRNAADIFDVLPDFLRFIDSRVVVGHWVHFDLCFLNKKLELCRARINNVSVDTCNIARAVLPGWNDYTLDYLLAHYRLGHDGRHTALGDAVLTARLFLTLLDALAASRGVTRWNELVYTLKLGLCREISIVY